MSRTLLAFAFSLIASGAALACPDGNCDKAHCPMSAAPASDSTAAVPADGKHVKLNVAGMHCSACADKVKTALLGVEGVKGASVDATTGVAEVSYDEKKVTNDKLIAAVASTGSYTATLAN
jgi:copper chaperone CopZ